MIVIDTNSIRTIQIRFKRYRFDSNDTDSIQTIQIRFKRYRFDSNDSKSVQTIQIRFKRYRFDSKSVQTIQIRFKRYRFDSNDSKWLAPLLFYTNVYNGLLKHELIFFNFQKLTFATIRFQNSIQFKENKVLRLQIQ